MIYSLPLHVLQLVNSPPYDKTMPEEGIPLGRSLPVYAIIATTLRGQTMIADTMNPNFRRKRQDIEETFVINKRNLSHKTVNLTLHGYYLTWCEFLLHEQRDSDGARAKKGWRSVLWQTGCTLGALIFTLTA